MKPTQQKLQTKSRSPTRSQSHSDMVKEITFSGETYWYQTKNKTNIREEIV